MPPRRIRKPKREPRTARGNNNGAIELLTEVIETLKGGRRLSSVKVPSTWRSGDLEIHTDMWIVRREGTVVPVTPKEFRIAWNRAAHFLHSRRPRSVKDVRR